MPHAFSIPITQPLGGRLYYYILNFMNLIIMYLLRIIGSYAAISGSFHISKWYILDYRLKKDNKADIIEKIMNYAGATIICFIVAGLVGMPNLTSSLAIAILIVLCICSFSGVYSGYKIDSAMTPEQKQLKRFMKKREEKEMEERGAYSEM